MTPKEKMIASINLVAAEHPEVLEINHPLPEVIESVMHDFPKLMDEPDGFRTCYYVALRRMGQGLPNYEI
jgi:hypothetical protein